MKVKVCVTQNHIDEGIAGNCGFCPIALAIKESGECDYVAVGLTQCNLRRAEAEYRKVEFYSMPEEAGLFVTNFDTYGKKGVSPFEFEMERM